MHSGRPCCLAVECGQWASVGSSSWVCLPVSWAQHGSATRRTRKGPTGWLWPVGPAWQQALLLCPVLLRSSPRTGVSLSSASWPHTLPGLLLRSVTPESQQSQETANSGPQEWQRLGLLEIELEELCIKAFEEIKGYNFKNEYIMKNDQECTGGFFNMELLEEKIQSLKWKKSLDRGDHGLKQLMREWGVGETAEELTPNWAEMLGDRKGEKKSESRGGQNENVQSTDVGERRGDRPYPNTREERDFQKLEITCCRKRVPASGLYGCRNLGADSDALSAEQSWSSAPWATGIPPGVPESVCSSWRHRPCCYLLWISQFQLLTCKTWLCFSHFHRPLFHREQKEPASRLGMFLLLQEVGPALPFTGSPSASPVTCSVSGPPRPTKSEHQFLQAVRGFCLQSVIWEMLMECLTSLLASHPQFF